MKHSRAILFALCAVAALWLCILPFASHSGVFLSPDETAVYQSAQAFAKTGSMQLASNLVEQFPWAHARSFVTLRNGIAPIGFIGMPMLVSAAFFAGIPVLGAFLAPILVLLSGYFIWRLTKQAEVSIRLLAVLSWFTLPNVILYTNRSLFPNLPAICFAFIGSALLWEKRSFPRAVIAGICAALALAIRPIDAVWILPWFLCAWRFRQNRQQCKERKYALSFLVAAFALSCIAVMVHVKTYGSLFSIGYFLRDPIVQETALTATSTATIRPTAPVVNWLPFGIHPRHVWFNIKNYILGILLPWSALVAAVLLMKRKQLKTSPWVWLGLWTLICCVMVYGQGIYQDHVGINVVSIGNSFLRYVLPCSIFVPFAVAQFLQSIQEKNVQPLRVICSLLVGSICAFGLATALWQGSESVIASSATLETYTQIQQQTKKLASPAVVVSDRSDKLFFLPQWSPVTPIPPMSEIVRFHAAHPEIQIYFFGRPLDAVGYAAWVDQGFHPLAEYQAGNEIMYHMEISDTQMEERDLPELPL